MGKYGLGHRSRDMAKNEGSEPSCEDYDYQINREKKEIKHLKKIMKIVTSHGVYLNSFDNNRYEIVGEIVIRINTLTRSIKDTKARKKRNKKLIKAQHNANKVKKSKRKTINEGK